jgi:hypothetical protein
VHDRARPARQVGADELKWINKIIFASPVYFHYLVVPGPGPQDDEFAAGQPHLLIYGSTQSQPWIISWYCLSVCVSTLLTITCNSAGSQVSLKPPLGSYKVS